MSIYINTKYSYEFYALKVHTQTIEIPFIHCFGYNFRINIPKIWLKFIPINIIILASYILLFHSEIQSIYFNYNPNTVISLNISLPNHPKHSPNLSNLYF
jgi:hypothetical protein